MLGKNDAEATVAVKDLQAARRFYAETLGLEQVHAEGEEALVYRAGKTTLLVYRSRFAGTNQATSVTWSVGDELESIVRALKDRGVKFEHYDMPGMKREGDLHIGGPMKAAWFKDPDGNIHALTGS
jgi:catechol 2,3-dioxygenase-like lactoylglutathione lyase family enzyme